MSIRVLIDLQGAQNGSRYRGIGRYSLALTKGIVRNAGKNRIFILLNGLFPESVEDIKRLFSDTLPADRFLVFSAPGPVSEVRAENDWRRITAEILREHVVDLLSPDVLLVTSMVEGAEDDTVTSLGRLQSAVPSAAVLYDLIPLTDPDRYIGWEPARLWYHNKVDSLRRADFLFAISESAAKEAINLLQCESEKVKSISSAADSSFSDVNVSSADTTAISKRYGISRKYLMHSSAFEGRKNFEGLIRAFAALPAAVRCEYQLVLVCKLDEAGRKTLEAVATRSALARGEMVLTGFVPDEDLVPLYVGCHLFVFPSFHEGFGLPPLEAMCCGTPAIGSKLTSVPEVIGRDDALFDPASVPEMTALILKALTDIDFYQSLKAHAKIQAAKFSWDDTARSAIEGLEALVASRRSQANGPYSEEAKRHNALEVLAEVARGIACNDVEILEVARSLEANENAVARMKASAAFGGALTWRLEGPFDSTYSLALLNRETARALTELGHTVVLHSTEGPGDFAANPEFLHLNSDLEAMHSRVASHPHEDVDAVSRNLYPPRVHDMRGGLNLLHHYAWEESGFPADWVASFNEHLDGLTCLSTHVEKVLLDNGVSIPMVTSGCGVDHWERVVASEGYRLDARTFRFLHVSSCFPRKGVDALLNAYGKAFTNTDDVSLVIKTFPNPHNEVHSMLAARRTEAPNYPNVVVIEGDLSDADLKALYQQCQVLVAPSRAEGFGLPMAEAMLSGLPVVTTAWSGQLDFCNEQTAWLVDFSFKPAESHFALSGSVWADPDVAALAQALSAVCSTSPAEIRAKAVAGRDLLLNNFKWSDVAARLVVASKRWKEGNGAAVEPRIGWITTWNTKCGIASYSQHLIENFPQPVTVLAPHQQGKIRDDGPECIRSWWSSKDENGFNELSLQIGRRGIDTLVLQFNYGFYNFRQLSQFIHEQVDARRAVIVMMHSTADPGLPPAWNWSVSELTLALARCARVLVHSVDDLNRMKEIGLVRNVSLFPHGVLDVQPRVPATDRVPRLPLIASYGYCLPHKGLTELVKSVALLRKSGKPVRLRLVNAEYPAAVSAKTVAQIRALVAELALGDLVDTHHDFLADEESLHLLQDADLIVYPYQQTNESASGAVRYGLATGKPVVVTPVSIFDDLGGAVHRLPGIAAEQLAEGLAAVLGEIAQSSATALQVAASADAWRAAHTYTALGARLHHIAKALAREVQPYARVFDGSSKQLRTVVGRISGRSLVSTGIDGYLVFGPYVSLARGEYAVFVIGKHDLPPGSKAYLDVAIANGAEVLLRVDIVGRADGLVVDANIFLANGCRDLEIRIAIDKRAKFRIDRIEVRAVVSESGHEASEVTQQVAAEV